MDLRGLIPLARGGCSSAVLLASAGYYVLGCRLTASGPCCRAHSPQLLCVPAQGYSQDWFASMGSWLQGRQSYKAVCSCSLSHSSACLAGRAHAHTHLLSFYSSKGGCPMAGSVCMGVVGLADKTACARCLKGCGPHYLLTVQQLAAMVSHPLCSGSGAGRPQLP